MDCNKIKKFYVKFCENDVKCDDKYSSNCTIAKEIRSTNCLKTIDLFAKYCKYGKIDENISIYDQK